MHARMSMRVGVDGKRGRGRKCQTSYLRIQPDEQGGGGELESSSPLLRGVSDKTRTLAPAPI